MHTTLRRASAMIELVFALVVMGIALMSAPMLISKATQSSYVAIQQEGINELASHINMILGYHWDEGDADETYYDPILTVLQGDSNLSTFKFGAWRVGTPKNSYRSLIREDGTKNIAATIPAMLGLDAGEAQGSEDDVDDFIGNYGLTLVSAATKDNVEKSGDINITTSVQYMNDSPGAGDYETTGYSTGDGKLTFSNLATTAVGSTNIKKITVTLTDTSGVSELNKTIVLNAFVCNIGAYKLAKKAF